MNKTTTLIFGKNEHRNAALVEQLQNSFQTVIVTSDEQAIEKFQQSNFDSVVFSDAVMAEERTKLEKIFSLQDDKTVFITDDDSNQVAPMISNAIAEKRKRNKPSFSFKDDALKNAGLNIKIQ
ncbi:MAG: hypothetical protein H7Y86_19425 [Rhizobacter sp.]|nr:hypothetical protein [Ferruginibacter sp.]